MGNYILSVTAAALVCAIANRCVHKPSVVAAVKLLTGIFMVLVVVSPLLKVQLQNVDDLFQNVYSEAQEMSQTAETAARSAMEEIISSQVQAYILDKAAALEAQVEVTVHLCQEDFPVPVSVTIKGALSPFVRQRLSWYITEELGIDSEEIEWIS